MFSKDDYDRAATALDVPSSYIQAVTAVESSGETFWEIDGRQLPPVRFEAHWFGKLTGYRFSGAYPNLSCYEWTPSLAATTRDGAWAQLETAMRLDPDAAMQATSWGPFQVMGFHYKTLGFKSVGDFVAEMSGPSDDGQMDIFVRFVKSKPGLWKALKDGDWETWEQIYNGGGQNGAYAAKIRKWLASHFAADGTLPLPRVLARGMVGLDVSALQKALGLPDTAGSFGPQTEAAVRKFQAEHGLLVDGVAGRMTKTALGIV